MAKLPVVDPGVLGDLTQVAAYQREMVAVVDTADRPQALHRGLVPQVASQGIAGVGRVDHDRTIPHQRRRLFDQAPLRCLRMDDEELGHALREAENHR